MEPYDALIRKWEDRLRNYTQYKKKEFATELKLCLSDAKAALTAEGFRYAPATLDSTCHFAKHKGRKWKIVIEIDPDYVDWCLGNVMGFRLDEFAFEYLLEKQKS